MSVAYIGLKSRTDGPKKTKIGTEVAHATCDSDTTFKVKRSKVKLTCEAGHIVAASPQLVISRYSILMRELIRNFRSSRCIVSNFKVLQYMAGFSFKYLVFFLSRNGVTKF